MKPSVCLKHCRHKGFLRQFPAPNSPASNKSSPHSLITGQPDCHAEPLHSLYCRTAYYPHQQQLHLLYYQCCTATPSSHTDSGSSGHRVLKLVLGDPDKPAVPAAIGRHGCRRSPRRRPSSANNYRSHRRPDAPHDRCAVAAPSCCCRRRRCYNRCSRAIPDALLLECLKGLDEVCLADRGEVLAVDLGASAVAMLQQILGSGVVGVVRDLRGGKGELGSSGSDRSSRSWGAVSSALYVICGGEGELTDLSDKTDLADPGGRRRRRLVWI